MWEDAEYLEAIHWEPAIRWVIDEIHVLEPIRFQSIRRNEVGSKASAAKAKSAMNRSDIVDDQPVPRQLDVPNFGGRSGKNAPPYFPWDNSAYVLGLSSKQNFDAQKRFVAFRALPLRERDGETDIGLVAVRKFLESWQPENAEPGSELVDRNLVFRLIDRHEFVHDSEAAKALWDRIYVPDTIEAAASLR